MKYYIINPDMGNKQNHDYKIISVKEVDESDFFKRYGKQIIAEGNTLLEAILSFEEWKNNQQEE